LELSIYGCRVKIEFSFVLILSFATLLCLSDLQYLLLFSALHELAHMIVLLMCGGKPNSLTFSFYGLALKYDSTLSTFRELLVIIAGPIVNLILYLIIRDDINLILFALNVLPIYPLDGGRVLRLYSYNISSVISKIFLVLIFGFSIFLVIEYNSFSLLLIAVYLTAYSILY
jgi:stage IV sporulation protein FB